MGDETHVSENTKPPSTPYLGRTVRVVGPVEPVDPATLPQQMAVAGKLGKSLGDWYSGTTPCPDPLVRVLVTARERDPKNSLKAILKSTPKGSVNPDRTEVADPVAMSRHIKEVAKFFGADLVGIARVHPAYLYKTPVTHPGKQDDSLPPETDHLEADTSGEQDICQKYPFAIICATAADYDMQQAHRHRIGDIAHRFNSQKLGVVGFNLGAYIRELGYETVDRMARPSPVAVAAGLGELGRNGLVISEKYGARIELLEPILTDLPLVADEPIDIGVDDFCKSCRKCATTCPTNSITHGGKVVHNGVEKYQINWKTCAALRPYTDDHWSACLTCITVCPYTKRSTWWHSLSIWALKHTPIPFRPLVIKPLKWSDDLIWGKAPKRRVKRLGYDSGIPPAERDCKVPGCTAHSDQAQGSTKRKGNQGYYVPLRENTKRFVR